MSAHPISLLARKRSETIASEQPLHAIGMPAVALDDMHQYLCPFVEPFIAQVHPQKSVLDPLLACAVFQVITQIMRVGTISLLFS